MKIGIFGSQRDAQCQAVSAMLRKRGVEVVMVESQGLNLGHDAAFTGEDFHYQQQLLHDVGGWYLRHIMSPMPPAYAQEDQYYLFNDWFVDYMQRRERFAFQLSWLIAESLRGKPVLNPPEHGSVLQLKPYQLLAARQVGFDTPRTVITNNPDRVRAFAREVDRVVYKPSMGGGLCLPLDERARERLDAITMAPVTFQEQVVGTSIRATLVGDDVVSCVKIPTASLDYRDDEAYQSGRQQYEEFALPDQTADKCRQLMRDCGLLFSGIDFIERADGSLVFLEANSSPIYLDIERKTLVPITDRLVCYLLDLANDHKRYQQRQGEACRTRNFVSYALPFDPKQSIAPSM